VDGRDAITRGAGALDGGAGAPGRSASAVPGRDASAVPGRDASTVPGLRASAVPGRDASAVPGRDASTVPGRDASTVPGLRASAVPGRDASVVPGRSTSTVPGMRASAVPGRDQVAAPGGRLPGARRRYLRRSLIIFGALLSAGIVAFAGLLAATPSVRNAEALARAQDRAHHAAFPGPPVPPRFAAAIVATEDHRFGSEPGIDLLAIGRVIAARLTGGTDQGGATIYQQLAKMLYTRGRSGVAVELEQIGLAVKLSMSYSSRQILQMYADVAYFGNGEYGLAAASCGYFGVPPARLSWPQAALLAGLVQAPSADDPRQHPDRARQREAHVIGRLVAVRRLTQAQATAALAQPVTRLVANSGAAGRCAA